MSFVRTLCTRLQAGLPVLLLVLLVKGQLLAQGTSPWLQAIDVCRPLSPAPLGGG